MKHTQLYQLIHLLIEEEDDEFKRWLAYRYEEKCAKPITLYTLLKASKNSKEICQELKIIPPNETNTNLPLALRKLATALKADIELFLAQKELENNALSRDLLLTDRLRSRGDHKIISHVYSQAIRKLEGEDSSFFEGKYKLLTSKQHYLIQTKNRQKEKYYGEIFESFELSWLYGYLFLSLTLLNNSISNPQLILRPDLLPTFVKDHHLIRQREGLKVLYKVIQLLENDPKKPIEPLPLLADVRFHKSIYSKSMIKNIFNCLLNYFSRAVSSTQNTHFKEAYFELYEWGIEDKLIYADKYLHPRHYKNIITAGLTLGYTAKAWEYLEVLKGDLHPSLRAEYYTINLANCHFVDGRLQIDKKCELVISVLSDQTFTVPENIVTSRKMILKAKYKLGERPTLETPCKSLIDYVKNQRQFSKNYAASHINWLNQFYKLLISYTPKKLNRLLEKTNNLNPMGDKQWLLAEITSKIK